MPAQPLANALVEFADVTGMTALVDGDLASGLHSSPVKGRLAPREALRILLAGTGVAIRYADAHAFTVGPAPPAQVGAPAPRGGSGDGRGGYFLKVQDAVEHALCGDGRTRPGGYRLAVQLFIADSGAVEAVHLLGSTGDDARDAAISAVLVRAGVAPPPRQLPQPLTIVLQQKAGAACCAPPACP